MSGLTGRLDSAAQRLRVLTDGTALAPQTDALLARLAAPIRVALVGTVKAGKSTLLNALLGQPVAPTDTGERTLHVTWYRHGVTYAASVEDHAGGLHPVTLRRGPKATEPDLSAHDPATIRRVLVDWPAPLLKRVTLVDTPGLDSLNREVSARTEHLLDHGTAPEVDALVVVTTHVHPRDLTLLAAFQDSLAGNAEPGHSIAVLSRADHIAGGATEALAEAQRAAERLASEAGLARFCQAVVPVAGLLAEGSALMTQADHTSLLAVAQAGPEVVERLLASADTFVAVADPAREEHRRLLERFGMFGVTTAVRALQADPGTSAPDLSALLADRSGIATLRELLAHRLVARADVLRLRALLAGLGTVLTQATDAALRGGLERLLEELVTGAHELVEHRLVTALRREDLALSALERDEVLRLLDDPVAPPWQRLGLPMDPGADDVHQHVVGAVDRWRRTAAHPLATATRREVAEAVSRTLEALAAR